MPAVARLGDREAVHCSPPRRAGHFRSVFANGKPLSGVGHKNTPHLLPCKCPVCCCVHTAPLKSGSPNVLAEGIPIGRVGDPTCTMVAQGSPNVFANGLGGGGKRRFGGIGSIGSLVGAVAGAGGGIPVDGNSPAGGGSYCFDPDTPIQMADAPDKKIKEIQLGDETKGGTVTGVFQFKAADDIHNYKGVIVAGSHYVKENGRFIPVSESPESVSIDRIPVVYSIDTTDRRIFINDIEFADYNGDGIAKEFLTNAGADLTGYNEEVLRQIESKLI